MDLVAEICRLTGDGVDVMFDGIGGENLRRAWVALREGGRVVVYGFQSEMRGGGMISGGGGRHPFREAVELGRFVIRTWFKPGRESALQHTAADAPEAVLVPP